jgi:hypothetical protein
MFETLSHNSMKTEVLPGELVWLQISPYAHHTCILEVCIDALLQER